MIRGHVDELYTAYLEDELPPHVRRDVEAHLRVCPRCAEALADMRCVVGFLRDLPDEPAPRDFAVVVRAGLPDRRSTGWPWPTWTWGTVAAAALLMLVFQFGYPLLTRAPMTPRPSMTASAPDDRGKGRADAPAAGNAVAPRPSVATTPAPPPVPAAPIATSPLAAPAPTVAPRLTEGVPSKAESKMDGVAAEAAPRNAQTSAMANAPASTTARVTAESTERAGITAEAAASKTMTDAAHENDAVAMGAPADTAPIMRDRMMAAPPAPGVYQDAPLLTSNAFSYATVNIEAQAISLPDKQSGQVRILTKSTAPMALTATLVDKNKVPVSGASPLMMQSASLAAPAGTMVVDVPGTRNGVTMNLRVAQGSAGTDFLLIAPGTQPRQGQSTLIARDRTIASLIQPLANDAGIYVLCPRSLAERKVSLTVRRVHPIQALNALADREGMKAMLANQVMTMAPKK